MSVLMDLGSLFRDTHRPNEAEDCFRKAAILAERQMGPDHPDVAISLGCLAELLGRRGEVAEAEPLMRRALKILETKNSEDRSGEIGQLLNNLAMVVKATGRFGEAEGLYKRSLAILEKCHGAEHLELASPLNNFGLLMLATGKLKRAELLIRRSLGILIRNTVNEGRQNQHLGSTIRNYEHVLLRMGRSRAEVQAQLNAVARPYGFRLGGGNES